MAKSVFKIKEEVENFETQYTVEETVNWERQKRKPKTFKEKLQHRFSGTEFYYLKEVVKNTPKEYCDDYYLAVKSLHEQSILPGQTTFKVLSYHRDNNTEEWQLINGNKLEDS